MLKQLHSPTHSVLDLDDEYVWVCCKGQDYRSHGHEAGHEDLGPQQIRHQREVPEIVKGHLCGERFEKYLVK